MNSRNLSETACLLSVEGEIDVYTSPQLKERIVQMAEGGVKHLILNLSQVEYLDSTGLGVLIGGLEAPARGRRQPCARRTGMRILRIFEITGLDKIFDIYPTEEEAAAREGVSL